MPPLFGGRAQRQAQILAGPHNQVKTLAQQQQGGVSGTIPGTSSSPQQAAVRTGAIQPYPTTAPKVAGVGHQVLNNAGHPVVVLGNLACTPDPSATPPPAVSSFQDGGFAFVDASGVPVAGYSQTAGLWGFAAGGGGGGGLTLDGLSDYTQGSNNSVAAGTYTGILFNGSASWVDTVNGTIISPGVYLIGLAVSAFGASGWMGWGNYATSGNESLDAIALTGFGPSIAVTIALVAGDLPFNPQWAVKTSTSPVFALAYAYRLAH